MGKRLTIALAVLASLPLLYAAAYLALVKAERPFNVALSGPGPFPREVRYRIGGTTSEQVFAPIHAVDKRIRRDHWTYGYDLEGILP